MSPRVRHNIRVVLVSLSLTVFVALLGGMVYEAVASAMDARRYPQVGRTYQVAGHAFNLHCTGTGSPTVVLESGLGLAGYGWFRVQPGVEGFARVCSYDRAGYGWSAPHKTPRSSRVIAEEMHTLLKAAGENGPFVLVGHSFGGFNIRVFHKLYPAEVAGLVLVDSSHEDQVSRMPAEMRNQMARIDRISGLLPAAINIGLVRLVNYFWELPVVPANVTGTPREVLRYQLLQPKLLRASREEMQRFDESASQVRESGMLGDKPLIVLTAGKPLNQAREFFRIWGQELQPSLARLSTRGQQRVIEDSTHLMNYDRPDAIVDAIRDVTSAVRSSPAVP